MVTVSFTHTEQNPSHDEGGGGGSRSHTETEQNPTHTEGAGGGRRGFIDTEINPTHIEGAGGGRRTFVDTELIPTHIEGAGGGRRSFVLVEIPPTYTLPTPTVTTDPATGIGTISATLNGTLDDDGGVPCDCWFEWGLDTNYGTETPPESKSTGETFSFELHDLVPGTTYHFRAVAKNLFGMGYGADMEFTTDISINRGHALSREEL